MWHLIIEFIECGHLGDGQSCKVEVACKLMAIFLQGGWGVQPAGHLRAQPMNGLAFWCVCIAIVGA